LRYFEDQTLRQLAATLDLSEEAAKKKVSRALEKLRVVLGRKGINSTSSLLGTALIASAVQPSPPALAAVINLPAAAAALPATILVKGTIQNDDLHKTSKPASPLRHSSGWLAAPDTLVFNT